MRIADDITQLVGNTPLVALRSLGVKGSTPSLASGTRTRSEQSAVGALWHIRMSVDPDFRNRRLTRPARLFSSSDPPF